MAFGSWLGPNWGFCLFYNCGAAVDVIHSCLCCVVTLIMHILAVLTALAFLLIGSLLFY